MLAGACETNRADLDATASTASGTITNDDQTLISIITAIVTHLEVTGAGTTSYTYTVSLSNPISQAATVRTHSLHDALPISDGDYTAVDEVLTFAAGSSGAALSQTVTVLVNKDSVVEPDEAFSISLSEPKFGGVTDTDRADLEIGRAHV